MSLTRALILVCSVLALAACGSTRIAQPADSGQDAKPSPPIEAIDEAAPGVWPVDPSDFVVTGTRTTCYQESATEDCMPAPENEKLLRSIEGKKRPMGPLASSEARAIAQLRLLHRGANARLRLIAWKSKPGKLCLAYDESHADGGSGGGPFGPCVARGRCGAICLAFPEGVTGATLGVVSAKANALRITFDGGRVATYRLDGPLAPNFPEDRVFMLDPGRRVVTGLELLVAEKVLAQEKRSDAEISVMCPDRPTAPAADECLERAGAK